MHAVILEVLDRSDQMSVLLKPTLVYIVESDLFL